MSHSGMSQSGIGESGFSAWLASACRELEAIARDVDPAVFDGFIEELLGARRIALHALGREGLMMRALTMRLFHLGLPVHVVGDMTTPPLLEGDLLVTSAGPGALDTTAALMRIVRKAGGRVVLLTAEPAAALAPLADRVLLIPARTMARASSDVSPFTMGSAFEAIQFMVSEYLVCCLAGRLRESEDAMRARHTNLE